VAEYYKTFVIALQPTVSQYVLASVVGHFKFVSGTAFVTTTRVHCGYSCYYNWSLPKLLQPIAAYRSYYRLQVPLQDYQSRSH
jgi:hypothetical protein